MTKLSRRAFELLTILALVAVPARAEDDGQKTLEAKNLKKVGPVFVLPVEAEIEAKWKDALKTKTAKVMPAQKASRQADAVVEAAKKQIERGKQYIDRIDTEIANANTIVKHNQLVAAYHKAEKALETLENQLDTAEQRAKDQRTAAMQAAEEFSEQLMATRKLFDKAERQYKSLEKDKKITAALAALDEADSKIKHKLGPSTTMLATGKKLTNLEGTVFSEAVPIRRTEGDLWTAAVVFGDKPAVEMEIDTGASSVVLPHKLAKELGLEPDADAPVIRGQLANGSIVQGRRVIAPRIRLGRFEVENVECMVFGPEYPDASALLGQSFLGKFVYKIDAVNSKLVMTALDGPDRSEKPKSKQSKSKD